MTSNEKITIMIIQGSFHTTDGYELLRKGLQAKGYPIIHPNLPSCSNIDSPHFPEITLTDDVSAIRTELDRLIEKEGKTVFVFMHSYGGIVGCEAIPEELSYAERRKQNLPGGVIHLFFAGGQFLPKGESVLTAFGESVNNNVDKVNGTFTMRNGAKTLYDALPESKAAYWESKMIPQPYGVQQTVVTREAHLYIPSTYLVQMNDKALTVPFQENFAETAKSHIERCSTGHSPQISDPDMLVNKIVEAVEKAVSGMKG